MYLLIIFSALIISLLLISLWAYYKTFYNNEKNYDMRRLPTGEQYEPYNHILKDLMDNMESTEGETVFVTAKDGIKLYGIYYHTADNAPLHIQFHGYKGNYLRDFCGGNKLARDMGHNTLVIQQRAHGKSEGRTISFGIKERYDCLEWIKYANDRFGTDTKIILSGVSMGAATVLMASGMNLPNNVKAVVADCPYSSPKEIINNVAKKMHYPTKFVFPFIWLGGLLYGHFNVLECDAISAIKKSKLPTLIIHGEDDRFVPCEMSHKIYDASNKEKVTLITFPNAAHGMSLIVDGERYTQELAAFISKAL